MYRHYASIIKANLYLGPSYISPKASVFKSFLFCICLKYYNAYNIYVVVYRQAYITRPNNFDVSLERNVVVGWFNAYWNSWHCPVPSLYIAPQHRGWCLRHVDRHASWLLVAVAIRRLPLKLPWILYSPSRCNALPPGKYIVYH